METNLLLLVSSAFMTFAWNGHLKFKDSPLWMVVIVSWLIASFEYCFQVAPIGSATAQSQRLSSRSGRR
jgi:uncharacterized protein (DUF486 family)